MQLMVEKADGSHEVYLHTKVLGTIAAALGECEILDTYSSEELAETVSLYLRRHHSNNAVCSDDIHSMILAVLADTGYEAAAQCLQDYRLRRKIHRQRQLVQSGGANARLSTGATISTGPELRDWNKSIIVQDLMEHEGLGRGLARTIAGLVEDKVLRLECSLVTTELIQALVHNEMLSLQRAQQALDDERLTALHIQRPQASEVFVAAS